MLDDWKFGLKRKFDIKCGIDLVVFIAIIVIVVSLLIKSNIKSIESVTYIGILLLLFLPAHFTTKNWIAKAIKQSLKLQSESLSVTTAEVVDTLSTQKKILDSLNTNAKNISALIDKLKNLANDTALTSKSTEKQVGHSINCSQKEHEAITANAEKMLVVRQKIQMITELILELSEHTQQIGNTISVVDDIAEQTNMLALNAAVEAARAGEHGKGFAVVAGEIRKLADESKQAITKITSLTSNIQYTTNSTVLATEEGSKEIEAVVKEINALSSNSETLLNLIGTTLEFLENLNQNAEKQGDIIEKINAIDEENKSISDDLIRIISSNTEKLEKLRVLSDEIRNSAIEG